MNMNISDQGHAKPTSSFSLPWLCWLCWVLFCLPWHAMTKSCHWSQRRNLGGEYVVHEDRGSTEWRQHRRHALVDRKRKLSVLFLLTFQPTMCLISLYDSYITLTKSYYLLLLFVSVALSHILHPRNVLFHQLLAIRNTAGIGSECSDLKCGRQLSRFDAEWINDSYETIKFAV
jgi:hypothetical protein